MISAFGIEHGDISKGLPSSMKGLNEVALRTNPMTADSHTAMRLTAHNSGKWAAKAKAKAKKSKSLNGILAHSAGFKAEQANGLMARKQSRDALTNRKLF